MACHEHDEVEHVQKHCSHCCKVFRLSAELMLFISFLSELQEVAYLRMCKTATMQTVQYEFLPV